ncbi:MAG TPA: NADH-quinone oxidoreductase subunit M [Aggregatilineales bacterium]|nr:NADH-quinone oxidoreductase subunit M [Aggregatilineales bacterium]
MNEFLTNIASSPFNATALNLILIVPTLAAIFLLLFIRDDQRVESRWIATIAMGICLLLSAYLFLAMIGASNSSAAVDRASQGLSFFIAETKIPWISGLGISYHVGIDGVTSPMVLLTGLAGFCGVLISWRIDDRTREFMAFFLLLVAGVYGVFVSLDVFLLFFWYEFAIFPMYLLIATWGWPVSREYAAMKLTLYILIGSVVALVGILVMYFAAGSFFSDPAHLATLRTALGNPNATAYSFDFTQFEAASRWAHFAPGQVGPFDLPGLGGISIARLWFPMIFIGFGVLAGLFPFHNWSPDGHVAAPTAVSMIHAGVLMKLGAYAALRLGVQLLPEGAKVHLPWIILLALVNVVYGAFIAFRQRDFKYVIGFSSVSHMGLVSLGFASMNLVGMSGAGLQMFSHGAMTALFFACVGMVYDQAHTRDIPSLSGFARKMPFVALAFIFGGLVSMGMPGLSGFIAEFPIMSGVWRGPIVDPATLRLAYFPTFNYYPIIAILAALGIIVTAAYVLRVVQQVFGGEFNEARFPGIRAVRFQDKFALSLLMLALLFVGLFPSIMSSMITSGMTPVVNALAQGVPAVGR